MKITKRALAILLTAAMLIGMVCAVPTVNAEIIPDDILASFTFEGDDSLKESTGKKDLTGNDVTLTNSAGDNVQIVNVGGDRGNVAQYATTTANNTGIYWNTSEFDPFSATGDNASLSFWLKIDTPPAANAKYTVFDAFQTGAGKSTPDKNQGAMMIEYWGAEKWDDCYFRVITSRYNDSAFNQNVYKYMDVAYAYAADTWVLFTYVQTGNTCAVYINGELAKLVSGSSATGACNKLNEVFDPNETDGTYGIGCHAEACWSNMSTIGCFDDFTIYNRALTAEEVAKLYNPNAGVDEQKVAEVAAMINALETPEPTEEYYNAYLAAKAAYDALGAAEKAQDELADAEAKLAAALAGYNNALIEANDGKVASFTFEGTDSEKLTEENGFVDLENTAGEKVTINGEGKNGETSAKFAQIDDHTGLLWYASDYNPLKYTGENATVSMWVNLAAQPNGVNYELFNFFDNKNNTSGAIMLEYNGTKITAVTSRKVADTNFIVDLENLERHNKYAISGDYTIPVGTWTLVTFVQEGTKSTIYVNGEMIASGTGYKLSDTLDSDLGVYSIGCRSPYTRWDSNDTVNGLIDDFAIYNRALTKVEIMEMVAPDLFEITDINVAPEELESGDYNITWNAKVTPNAELGDDPIGEINSSVKFREYGAIYGVSKEAVMANEIDESTARKAVFAEDKNREDDQDVTVYTAFGLRLKGVPDGATRAARFYITYEYNGVEYTEYSGAVDCTIGE